MRVQAKWSIGDSDVHLGLGVDSDVPLDLGVDSDFHSEEDSGIHSEGSDIHTGDSGILIDLDTRTMEDAATQTAVTESAGALIKAEC